MKNVHPKVFTVNHIGVERQTTIRTTCKSSHLELFRAGNWYSPTTPSKQVSRETILSSGSTWRRYQRFRHSH
jgi:hypothetical protein